jgi:hypothetical protein
MVPIAARLLAAAVPALLGVETAALAQQEPSRPPVTDPGTPPALPPLPQPPAEPPSPPQPANTRMNVDWHAAVSPAPSTAPTTDDEPPRPAHHEEPERRWYGWQIILTDSAAIVSVGIAQAPNRNGWGDLAAVLYLGGGPVVHLSHENFGYGAGSLGLRVGLPLGGALLGAILGAATGGSNPDCSWFCPSPSLIGAGVGILVGMLAASVVDIAVLAYDVQPAGSHAASAPLRLQLAPVAALPRDSAGHVAPTFGLVGSF